MAIVIRQVRPEDRKAVLAICRDTWHGWDYIPLFFNRWVREKGFYCLAEGKRIIGLAKYTELSPGEFWLEGLRIAPDQRGQGLGLALSRFILKQVLAQRPVSLRLATGRRNRHSRAIIRQMGLVLKLALWERHGRVPKRAGRPEVFVPRPEEAFGYIRKTEEYRASKHLLQHTWQFRTITLELLTELARARRIFACGAPGKLTGLLILQPGLYGGGRLDISFLEGDRRALAEFHRKIAAEARRRKASSISGMARGRSMLRHLGGLRMRGWRRSGRLPPVLVYEYPLNRPLGHR